MVRHKPERYHTVTPYLVAADADGLMDFMQKVFDAVVLRSMRRPDGTVGHCEIEIGDSIIMLGGCTQNVAARTGMLHVYVEDVDATYARAIAAGATTITAPTNTFYGDRTGGVTDAAGNQWWIATHVEDVSDEETARRAAGK